jgi:hypothetical protein
MPETLPPTSSCVALASKKKKPSENSDGCLDVRA